MDLNVIVLAGTLAAEPETRRFDSGATMTRFLLTVRSSSPRRRVDVIPVVLWDPDDHDELPDARGQRTWVVGSVQRRFWSSGDGHRSRVEIVAHEVRRRVETGSEEVLETA